MCVRDTVQYVEANWLVSGLDLALVSPVLALRCKSLGRCYVNYRFGEG